MRTLRAEGPGVSGVPSQTRQARRTGLTGRSLTGGHGQQRQNRDQQHQQQSPSRKMLSHFLPSLLSPPFAVADIRPTTRTPGAPAVEAARYDIAQVSGCQPPGLPIQGRRIRRAPRRARCSQRPLSEAHLGLTRWRSPREWLTRPAPVWPWQTLGCYGVTLRDGDNPASDPRSIARLCAT